MEDPDKDAHMQPSGDLHRAEDPNAHQALEYSAAIGRGIPAEEVAELREFLHDVRPFEKYGSHADIRFIYEIMETDEWRPRIRRTVDIWINNQNESNIQRAAKSVGREVPINTSSIVRGFCVFRLKAFADHEGTKGPAWLGIDSEEPQTVVFIALDDLGLHNGFFIELEKGSDICLDSKANVQFPVSGGGMGIFIALNL